MIYRRRTYQVRPDQVAPFTAFFQEYLLPNQTKHGARLVGRWVNADQTEIVALWEYHSLEAYQAIQAAVAADDLHRIAQARRAQLPPLYEAVREEFLEPTVTPPRPPRHIVSVSGCVTNGQGQVLLVRTHWRSDTWEMPGGQVEEGEDLITAVIREVHEESGIEAAVDGITGVYSNQEKGIVNLVMRGQAVGGALRTSPETVEAGFFDPQQARALVTRPHFRTRLDDALNGQTIPYRP